MKKVLSIVIVIALAITFGVSAFFVGRYVYQSRKEKAENDKLQQMVQDGTRPTAGEQQNETVNQGDHVTPTIQDKDDNDQISDSGMLKRYEEVYKLNGDMVGWIQIEGTKVDYPVMHTPQSPNYYLKRNFNGDYSEWGCIYMREECDFNKPSDNVTIYGHNMNDGSMFGDLRKYNDVNFYKDHKYIFLDSLTEYHVYEIFSVFKTTANQGEGFAYHQMEDAANEKEFNTFVKTCKDLSFYDTGITPVYGDKLLCLSTCEYTLDNGRLVVAARRVN